MVRPFVVTSWWKIPLWRMFYVPRILARKFYDRKFQWGNTLHYSLLWSYLSFRSKLNKLLFVYHQVSSMYNSKKSPKEEKATNAPNNKSFTPPENTKLPLIHFQTLLMTSFRSILGMSYQSWFGSFPASTNCWHLNERIHHHPKGSLLMIAN